MKWRWLAAMTPVAVGIALKIVTLAGWLENRVLFLRGDVGTLALLGGALLSGVASILHVQAVRAERQRQDDVVEIQTRTAEERRQFLRRLDHELKNPLTAIQVGLANIAGALSPETQRAALESVQSQTLRLSRLSADLKDIGPG